MNENGNANGMNVWRGFNLTACFLVVDGAFEDYDECILTTIISSLRAQLVRDSVVVE